jgi:hypothetical protein
MLKDGWKSKTAGGLMILSGLCGIGIHVLAGADATGAMTFSQAGMIALAGLTTLGLAGKLQKIIEALKK